MLYHLFEYLDSQFDMPGAGLFDFISFRAGMAIITSLVISLIFGGKNAVIIVTTSRVDLQGNFFLKNISF